LSRAYLPLVLPFPVLCFKKLKNPKKQIKTPKIRIRDPPYVSAFLKNSLVQILIDSGSTGNFISLELVKNLGLQHSPLSQPRTLYFANRSHAIIENYLATTLSINGAKFDVTLEIVPDLAHPVILGMPWLRRFNPVIEWNNSTESARILEIRAKGSESDQNLVVAGYAPGAQVFMGSEDTNALQSTTSPMNTSEDFPEDLESDANCPDLSEVLTILPAKYSQLASVFSKANSEVLPPERRLFDCAIKLKNEEMIPPFKPLYNLSATELSTLANYIKENLAKGFIRPSKSPAGAPIFFVKKKGGDLRPCVDYRGLNEMTVKNRYPLPLISELLDRLGSARVFTKIDLRGAYNLVRIKPGDEWKTAFRTRFGHFEYLVMPFGLTNAPAVFQDLMNAIFRDVLDIFVIIYLDDILVFSPDQEAHDKHVLFVLERLRKNNLYGKLSKSEFDKHSIEFLGFVVTTSGVEMSQEKISAVKNWKQPTSRVQVQSFLGFTNFYRRFISGYSRIAKPLTELTKKDHPFEWNTEALTAFQTLQLAITTAPVLIHPDHTAHFTLETDASDFALGAVLLQKGTDDQLHFFLYLLKLY
jgi:Reverse transcriptase (RNA-dependent DNA polymerase)/RNase H-like domain found in reverse transcriptase/Retroviral aspartyl protease